MPARRPRRALLAAALAALVLPAAARAADAGTVTAAGGPVQATLSWKAGELAASDPRLTVVRAGATLVDGPPTSDCGDTCIYAASGRRSSPLQVVDLDADGEPEVLVDVFTGGAHCCAETEILRFTGAGYADQRASWGNGGYELRDLDGDGRPELVSQDDAFAAAFTSYAASFFPPRVLDYDAAAPGALRDVTRSFPALARRNARDALRALRSARRRDLETLGVVAAYAADLELLGRGREVRPYLARARRRGDLVTFEGPAPRSFERRLLAFLHRQGYR
jgi:hypothetical protein